MLRSYCRPFRKPILAFCLGLSRQCLYGAVFMRPCLDSSLKIGCQHEFSKRSISELRNYQEFELSNVAVLGARCCCCNCIRCVATRHCPWHTRCSIAQCDPPRLFHVLLIRLHGAVGAAHPHTRTHTPTPTHTPTHTHTHTHIAPSPVLTPLLGYIE